MSNISGILTTLNSPGAFEDLSPIIAETAAMYSVPLLALLPRTSAANVKHEWFEDRRKSLSDSLGAACDNDDTDITVADGTKFRVRDLVRIESEVLLVTSRTGNTLTVVRGFGETAPAAHADDSPAEIIGNANLEGATAIESNATARVRKYNMTQIFQTRVEVSGSRGEVNSAGGDELSYQVLKQLREHLVEIERAVISGTRCDGDATTPRTMAGLTETIATHVTPVNGTLTQAAFINFLRGIFADGGQPGLILASPLAVQAINFWGKGSIMAKSDDSLFGMAYAEYLCEFGLLRILMDRFVPSGSLFALDPELISYAPLASRDTHIIPLARTGDADSALIITEATVELRDEYCHGMLTGITGGA
ncbi:MAG: DUF5309 family protein [Candidatus Brocadiia bacterium]